MEPGAFKKLGYRDFVLRSESRIILSQIDNEFDKGDDRWDKCPEEKQVNDSNADLPKIELMGTDAAKKEC